MKQSHSKATALESINQPSDDGALVFRTIGEILSKKPSDEGNLVGDCHILKGAVTLIGGEPGCGKSLAALNLAIAGALKSDKSRKDVSWLGMKVNREFTSMVIQFENGALRLYKEATQYPKFDYGERIFISNPPTFGERFGEEKFGKKIRQAKKIIEPDVVIIDPWTSISDGDHREAVVQVISEIRRVFGSDEKSPALVIVSHTAKPRGKNTKGVAMLHDIAGSFALAAHARVVFILERGSKEPESDLVTCTCAKNNNGELGPVTHWHRRAGAFEKVEEKVVIAAKREESKKKKSPSERYAERASSAETLILSCLSNSTDLSSPRRALVAAVQESGIGQKELTDKVLKILEEGRKIERFRQGKEHIIKLMESPESNSSEGGGQN